MLDDIGAAEPEPPCPIAVSSGLDFIRASYPGWLASSSLVDSQANENMLKSAIIRDLNLTPEVEAFKGFDFLCNNGSGSSCTKERESNNWKGLNLVPRHRYSGAWTTGSSEKIQLQRKQLPIYQFREQFVNAVQYNQVVVVVGETGSGKSTQMPQYLLERGLIRGRIGVTQPRRVATVSVAARVAEEIGCRVGELVGYSIRFEDITSHCTVIKYMTDGLLVMECLRDPFFTAYDCIILDEAHERTLHTDVLLGVLKKALSERPELKVVITSATLDIKKFADYFSAPMVKIPGKTYPVTIKYLDRNSLSKGCLETNWPGKRTSLWCGAKKSVHYISAAVDKVLEVHTRFLSQPGDILLFLPGKEEVEQACAALSGQSKCFLVLPVYAAMPFEAQCEIFASAGPGVRKVVVATNIAETSITIDGILFVIDTGLFKESRYYNGIDTLKVSVICQAQAEQRAGRAGRTAPGICYRLYTEADYCNMKVVPAPAIHRIDLTSMVLQLKAMGIDDVCRFGFMDPPKTGSVAYALRRLRALGATESGDAMTKLGFQMAEFPLVPNLSKILLCAAQMECSDEVLTVVSMLSVKNVFVRNKRRLREADVARLRFDDPVSDHLTLLNVYNAWRREGMAEEWAKENFVHQKELERANDVRSQLLGLMKLHGVPIVSAGKYWSNIRKALSMGEPNKLARYVNDPCDRRAFVTLVTKQIVHIHPSSTLYNCEQPPEFVIYHETVTTSRTFMRTVSACQGRWVERFRNRFR